ncbi:MAG: hypothetical protein L0J77_02510 [Marinobacter sp.]|nr:hypothetical protein [Marinobacter sp.]
MKKRASRMHRLIKVCIQQLANMRFLWVVAWLLVPVVCAAAGPDEVVDEVSAEKDRLVRLSIDGISASIGEDEPRVLTILPWRAPTLPRRPRAELERSAPELVQPLDPLVLEQHREFRQSLGVKANTGALRSGGRQ